MRFDFPDGELGTWACLGAVTEDAARVWFHAEDAVPSLARLRVHGDVCAEAPLVPDHLAGRVAVADLVPQRPMPGERFTVEVGGARREGVFAPTVGSPAQLAFAFGSCHEPFERLDSTVLRAHAGAGIYRAMAKELRARDTRFVLLVGDQVYSDGVPAMDIRGELKRRSVFPDDVELLNIYRHLYRGYFNETGFRDLLEQWPSLMVWDDHDIFDGWGSLTSLDERDWQLYRAAERAYREFQDLHWTGATLEQAAAPYHRRLWYGDVGLFVFDLRSVRDYRRGVLLGERQWRDFEAFLAEASERGIYTLFIVASVPIVHFSPLLVRSLAWYPGQKGSDVRDRWCARPFAAERDALLDRLFAWQSAQPRRQVIVLSGDVHVGAAFEVNARRGPGLFHQWTSSPLTTPTNRGQALANRIGTTLVHLGEWHLRARRTALVVDNNFGLVEVEPLPGGGHRVAFTLYRYDEPARAARVAAQALALPT